MENSKKHLLKYASSSLLNRPEYNSTAAISSRLIVDSNGGVKDAQLAISACNDAIHLDVYPDAKRVGNQLKPTVDSIENIIFKLTTLSDEVIKLRDKFLEYREIVKNSDQD